MNNYYDRIDKINNINILADLVCQEYNLGSLVKSHLVEVGYEDFNLKITTSKGKYLVKVFRNSRSDKEAEECINRNYIAYKHRVKTPKVHKNSKGEILTIINYNGSRFRLSLIEYIDGKTFFDLKRKPTNKELLRIVDLGSKINRIIYKPNFIYDSWAITSFCDEYEKKEKYIEQKYLNILKPIYESFKIFDYSLLPFSFVHGDLRSTNLILDDKGEIYAIDFSVSNYTARLNEIIVICSEVAIIPNNKVESEKRIKSAFMEWCNKVRATEFEKESFKLLFSVANAINVLNSAYELATGNNSEETKMYLESGLFALTLFK